MKSFDIYAELELISPEDAQKAAHSFKSSQRDKSTFKTAWRFAQGVCKRVAGSSEPSVMERCDRQGNPYYEIYDPISRQRVHCETESEVRAWLEQRYYLD